MIFITFLFAIENNISVSLYKSNSCLTFCKVFQIIIICNRFVMQRGFDAVPLPLLEAAAIDGATPWQQFARIGLPVGLPGILAALTMSFLDAWNALEQPMTFLKTQSLWSLSLYLTDTTRDLALTMAASLFALLPAVLIFAFGQKYLEQGILAGAVKG